MNYLDHWVCENLKRKRIFINGGYQMNRNDLLKQAGSMVIIYYSQDNMECFAIGWFYAMDILAIKLKVTSTKYETFENITIDLSEITKIETYQFND
jgi:hypothetical protein